MFSLLYVDDEQGLLDLGQLFLESDGEFRVTTAISAEAGLRALAEQDFDAVVSDYQMPEMNGIEFLKRVRKNYGNIPFILFTGRGREEVVIEAINNGVDFYLQKGGDPKSQFAELAHKVRQAVTRRRAEAALSESEKRLADIINFLPDATFAIDKDGRVIAWNHAIEEMTGIAATEMLGKGNHEYALPFYNTRRPILIDLIFEPEEVIAKNYANITRNKDLLSADTTLPRPKGREVTLMGVAGPLYDRSGQLIGAIESIRDITERKRAEESLNESERRFRELADLLPQGIYETDTRGRMTYVNRIALEMSGYTPEDILTGMNALDVIAPVDRKRAAAVFFRMVETGIRDQGSAEYLAVRKDGSLFPVSIYSSPITRDGKITGTRGVILDITDQKKAGERLLSANREYTSLLDQIQDIYYFADTAGKLVRASRSLATLLGFDDIAECIGRSIADDFYYNPADRQRLLDELNRNGKVTGFEVLLKRKDGAPVLVEVSSHLSRDQEGHVNGVEGTFHDITARKKAEDDLRAAYELLTANEEELKEQYNELVESEKRIRESEQKYRTVFETTGTAMLMIEEDTTISLVNDEFSRLSGYPREEIENKKRWMEFVVPQDRDRMLAQHRRRRSDPGIALTQYEFRFMTRTGEIRDILLSIDIIPGTRKSVASLLDITERKKAADEIQAVNEQLVASDEELRAQYDELAYSEKLIRMSEARLQFMLGFYEYSKKSEKELLEYAIEGAGIVTGSTLGYLAFLNDDETELSMYAWSKNAMAECSMITKPIIYQVEKTGLWGEAVRQRRPVITNDYAAPDPAKKGYPEGHPHIIRHMNVPVIDNGHIVLVAGVANRPGDYTEHDVNELLLLMQGLWEILKRRRVQEAKNAADEMLRKSEEELRLLKISTDRSSDQIFWLDFAGNILYVNDAAIRDYGYSREEFSRMKIFELNPDVNAEIWRRSVEDLRERKNQFITTRHRRRDGSIMDVEIVGVYVNQGDREYSFAYVRDITARTKTETDLKTAYEKVTAAEEELREQYDNLAAAEAEISSRKQQLEEIAATVPGVVYQFYARPDGSRGMYFVSSRTWEVFGLEPDLERFFPEFTTCVHPDDRARFIASIDEVVQKRSDWHFEGRFIRGSGEAIWFEGRSTPVTRGGELVYSGVLLDITNRKNMEAAIQESEQRYREIFNTVNDTIWVHDIETFRFVYVNNTVEEMFGYRPDEALNLSLTDISTNEPPFTQETAVAFMKKAAAGMPQTFEWHCRHKDGHMFWSEVNLRRGTIAGKDYLIAIERDIDERKQTEIIIRQQQQQLDNFMKNLPVGTFRNTPGPSGRRILANPIIARMHGFDSMEEFMECPVADTYADPAEREAVSDRLILEGSLSNIEIRLKKKNGDLFWGRISAVAVREPDGTVKYFDGIIDDITEEKRAETAIRESEERYRSLVELSPDAVVVHGGGKVLYANPGALRLLGAASLEEVLGRDVLPFVHPDDRAMALEDFRLLFEEGQTIPLKEERLLRLDGETVTVEITAAPIQFRSGPAVIAVFRDITLRKQAEAALAESERKYRTVFETAEEGIWIIDSGFRTVSANRKMQELFGYSAEEMAGRPVWDFVPPDEVESMKLELSKRPRGVPGRYERRWVKKDGTVIWCLTSATPLFSPWGEFLGSFGMFTDSTERKQMEEALRASEAKYRLLVENITFGITLIDADHRILMSNAAQGQMFHTDPGLWAGRYCYREFEKRDEVCAHCPGTRAMATGTCHVVETEGVRDDGTRFSARVHAIPLPDAEGKATRFIEVVEDITERKIAEDALRQNEEKYRTLIETTGTGFVIIDQDGRVLDANQEYIRLTGHTHLEEIAGRSVTEWTAEHLREKNAEAVRQCMQNGFIRNFEVDYAHRDGTIIPIEINATVLHAKGSVQILTLCRDITERKQAEAALRQANLVVENSPVVLFRWVAREGWPVAFVSRNVSQFGYTPEELMSGTVPYASIVHPDDLEQVAREVQKYSSEGPDEYQQEYRIITRDGNIRWIDDRTVIERDEDGKITHYQGIIIDITERKRAEDALIKTGNFTRALLDAIPTPVFYKDREGRYLGCNRAFTDIMGVSSEQLAGKTVFELWPSELSETYHRKDLELMENPQHQIYEFSVRDREGKIRPVIYAKDVFFDEAGQVAGIVGAFLDISGMKQAEQALRESESTLSSIFRAAPTGIGLVVNRVIMKVNDLLCEMTGYSPDELLGKNARILYPSDEDYEYVGREKYEQIRKYGTGTVETRWQRKDGRVIDVLLSSTPLDPADQGKGVTFTALDITTRKTMETALRESEAKFRGIIDQSFEFVGLMTTDGILIDVNRTALQLVGTTGTEVLNRPFWDTPWWSHSKELQEKLKDAIRRAATGETVRFEATHPAADGHLAYIDFSVKPAVDSDGTIRYLIPEGRDITGRKRVEDELMRLKISTDRSSDEIFWLDFAGNILYANDAACRITGYSHEEFSKMKIFELDPDFPPEVWDASVADLREKKTQFITTRHRCRDGTIINVEIVSVYVNQDDREYSFAYVRDITGRRQMENALRESEEKYRTLVESSFDGIAIHQDGRMVYVNQTAARLLGYDDPGQIIGIPAIDIVAPAFRGMIARRIQESSEKPMELIREQFLRFDGTSIDVDVTTIPTSWEGRPATYVTFRDITAQVRAEEGLRENEEKYRTLVEVNRDIIYSLGTDGTILYISPQTETQLGYRPDEMIGQNFSNYIHPDDLGTLLNHIQEHAGTGTDIQADRFRVRRNDGAYRWYEDKSIYTSDHRGGWIVAGTIRDITDEKAAQDALRESEEKFRALVETTSDFIWEVDAAGKYTYVSPQVRRILGYAPEELTGKTPFDLMPPEEASGIAAEFNRCVLGRLPITALENKALTKDGSVVILETSGVVRTAEDGSFQGYRGIDRDITERKQTEEALRKKTEEFNQFFTANLDLFCIADTDGYFRRLNPQWERTLGYSLAELEGHRFLDFVHPDDLKQTLAAVSLLGTQKAVLNFTNRYRHRDGTYRWIEWRALPIGNTIFAAARDITDRYLAAERTTRISALKQDLLRTAPLEEKLKRITDGIVHIFGADFARIWITGTGDLCERGCIHAVKTTGSGACRDRTRCLHLVVSSGRYTHIDGGHRRVPFGAYKIGRVATGQDEKFITNDVTHDPRVHDHAWAASLGLVSFAGFRLVSAEGTPVGVLAFFSRMPVLPEMMEDLADLATTASQVIQTGMTELALRESEARLGSILHGSPVLQFVIDRSHRVISWNRALEEYSGIRAADIIGTDLQWRAFYAKKRPVLADLLVDQDIEEIDTWYAGKFTKSHDIEGAYTATDFFPYMGGSGKWLSFTAAPVRDEKGTIIGAVETLEDITERVNAENALRQSEEWARTILNTAQTGIVIVDADTHRILEANKKALDLIGLPAESVIGSVCHRFICPAEEGKCPVTDCGMTVDTSERILIAANGSHILVLKTVIPVTMGSRNFLVESFVDISEQKRSESAIREANRKLNLLSSITRHDLVNQLTVLHGYTQLAAMKEPDPVVKDFLGKIETAVETMQRQIQFTKEYQELGVHAPAWFNIGEVIRGARPKKVRLQCSCDDFEVFADPLIGRVFYNLFDNAMKYGGHVTTITAGCKKQGDELLVTFADNGVGIPLDEKKKIFDKGYGKNTGFGLFLAREILAITGITIHETGMEGKGARFEIVVPKGAFREKT